MRCIATNNCFSRDSISGRPPPQVDIGGPNRIRTCDLLRVRQMSKTELDDRPSEVGLSFRCKNFSECFDRVRSESTLKGRGLPSVPGTPLPPISGRARGELKRIVESAQSLPRHRSRTFRFGRRGFFETLALLMEELDDVCEFTSLEAGAHSFTLVIRHR